ncbi:pentatricopeptide repeat-containing protein [Artemisia annua]|uniref:Pentatricopeptide repeat-containing protein n=1 Tax=Artemisia annua TaxID=35608 RepID=A0A2U1Q0R3_ARTAN|nr:pentatricopeptide repeat-containing protein [Artemisia annua]
MLSVDRIKPNGYTYPSLFKACGSKLESNSVWVKYGRALHTHVVKYLDPVECDEFVYASLISFYSKCGKFGVCKYLFGRVSRPDLGLWNCMLSACNNGVNDSGMSTDVLCLFSDMQKDLRVKPNEVSFVALINACGNLGAFSQGVWAHCYVVKNSLKVNWFVATALIDFYVNCGFLEFARKVFDELAKKDVFCYNAMIRGFATHGYGREALELFKEMRSEGLAPDDVTMVVVISACSHVGLVDEGCEFFYSMRERYGLDPKVEHYGCLVDLLGRAGRVNEAMEILQTMPMKPNAVLWRSLLGATRNHGNLEIAEIALDHLIELEPETSGNYVLLSNIYAHMSKWEGVKRVRRLMKDHGIDKVPGTSVLELGGVFHEFLTADKTHPQSHEIYLKIDEINRRLHEYGHTARTVEVLFDLEDEDREDALSYHSERLAIAFALVSYEPDSAIRIIKNLRVCVDCHDYTKLVSVIYKREIIVRDRNRFHHFRDGICSCLDYW